MTPPVGAICLNHAGLNPTASVQVVPVPWRGGAAVSLPAEPKPVLAALLLEELLEHADPRQPVG